MTKLKKKIKSVKKPGATKKRAMRFNTGKRQWHLLDFRLLEGFVRVMEKGAAKYAPDNWRKGSPVTELADCTMRHFVAYMAGENNDPEDGESHLDHIMCNIMFLKNVESTPSLTKRFNDRRAPIK